MAEFDLSTGPGTTIDLGRLRPVGRSALAIALAVGLAAAALATLYTSPVAVEARRLVEPAVKSRVAAEDDRLVAAQIGLLRADDFLRRVATAPTAGGGAGSDRAAMDRAQRDLATLQDGLSVTRVDRSRILALRLATSDEAVGRRLLAAVHDGWIAALAETRARAEADVDRRFAAEIDAARQRLETAEAEAAAAATAVAPAPAVDEVEALRAERVEAEARLKRLDEFAGEGADGVERAVDAAPTPGLEELRHKRSLLRARLAELSITYLANHPSMKQANADLDDLRRQMRAELPRAVAAAAARVADLDRRLAEHAAETTASIPPTTPPDVASSRAALDEAVVRRDAARREAVDRVGVSIRSLGDVEVVEAASPGVVASVGAAAAGGSLLVAFFGFAGRRSRTSPTPPPVTLFDPEVASASTPRSSDVEAVAATPSRPSATPEAEAARRADLAFLAARDAATRLAREIRRELGSDARVVVVSIADPALASGAARALAAASDGAAGFVDLCGAIDPAVPGISDLLDGRVVFSEAIGRDPSTGAGIVGCGGRPLDDADLGDPAFDALLDACAVGWGGLVISAGRLEAGEGQTALFVGADAIVLAEEDRDDPRIARVRDAFLDAGRPAWVLCPSDPTETVTLGDDPESEDEPWAAAA